MNKAQMKKAKGGIYKGRPAAAAGGGTHAIKRPDGAGHASAGPDMAKRYVGENLGYGTGGCVGGVEGRKGYVEHHDDMF